MCCKATLRCVRPPRLLEVPFRGWGEAILEQKGGGAMPAVGWTQVHAGTSGPEGGEGEWALQRRLGRPHPTIPTPHYSPHYSAPHTPNYSPVCTHAFPCLFRCKGCCCWGRCGGAQGTPAVGGGTAQEEKTTSKQLVPRVFVARSRLQQQRQRR